MYCRFTRVAGLLCLMAGVFTSLASAESITYQWQGDKGFTGFFSLDSSQFNTSQPENVIFQSKLTAFSFNGPGFTFGFADIVPNSVIFFDTTKNPPRYVDGGGTAASDAFGNDLIFFPDSITFESFTGASISSTGDFVVASTPEPSYGALLIGGIGALIAVRRRLLGSL